MALTQLGTGLWQHRHTMRPAPAVTLPCATAIARLDDGDLALISPGPLSDDDAAEIDALGRVGWLLGPNLYHHLHLRPAKERWPDARLLVAPGLETKRANLAVDGLLGADELPDGLSAYAVQGTPGFNEVVFLHRASSSLIVTDLVFNLGRPAGCMSPLVYRIFGTYDKLACSRLWRLFIKERSAFDRSLAELLELEFDRLVVAHGDSVHPGGREALASAIANQWGVGRP